jgi:FkbM family methyltransferase
VHGFIERFFYLKRTGVELERALDIGAYRGEFTNIIKSVWPTCHVQQFEADKRNKQYLQPDAVFEVLGDQEQAIKLYTIDDTGWGSTSGTSIYKENTDFYKNSISSLHSMKVLDSLVDMSGDWSKGLVKIDTQGSELIILQGANEFLKLNPMYILLECSYIEYNQGAPLITDVFKYMNSIGYIPIDVIDNNYINGQLIQSDVLFKLL